MSTVWTTADIPDQTGRTILITGANSGIGFAAARVLVASGAHVVLGCRTQSKAEEAAAKIAADSSPGSTEILKLDLADLDSVGEAAKAFLVKHDRLDILVNNAGVMATPKQVTAQSFELQFGVNHLGHFALTGLLLEVLMASGPARVVTVSSQGHRPGRINFDDLQSESAYSPWRAYFQSKLANLLFTRELQHRLAVAGRELIAVAAHPGGASTNLGHENPGGFMSSAMELLRPVMNRFMLQSAQDGALPTLRAATDPSATGADYYGPAGLGEQKGDPVKVKMSARALDYSSAARLWAVSEELTGVTYVI